MDIPPNDGYILVDEDNNIVARLSRSAVEDPPQLVPFKGLRITKELPPLAHLDDLFNIDSWIPD